MALPATGATDVLDLGADWEPQNSGGALAQTPLRAGGANGDFSAEAAITPIESGTADYIYVGAETGFIAALLAAEALPGFLVATDTLFIKGVAIDYSPCARSERPLIKFTVEDGPTSAPAAPYYYTSALTLPTYVAASPVVPALLTVTAGDAECINSQWSLTCQLGRSLTKAGAFLAGQGYQGEETLALTFKGVPTSITSTGWLQTAGIATKLANTANTDYPDHAYAFARKVTRTLVV